MKEHTKLFGALEKFLLKQEPSLELKETVFQISITPQENQIGQELTLINESLLTGTDTFTGKIYQSSDEAISTKLKDDISVDYSGGEIVE